MEGYGLTESSPVVSLNVPWAHRPGSVGRALPGVHVEAVGGKDDGLLAGEEGELVISGHCVMQGYHNKPDETRAMIRGGRLFTGDIGRVDGDGFIYITGRAKEMMIVGGENIFPAEIENALLEHPAVAEAGVIGAPDRLRGEAPVAFVILKEGASAEEIELRSFCRTKLAGHKAPREIRIAQTLPRSPTGKILRRGLRELL
jgi:long-chain acyl-CoA synthetase